MFHKKVPTILKCQFVPDNTQMQIIKNKHYHEDHGGKEETVQLKC